MFINHANTQKSMKDWRIGYLKFALNQFERQRDKWDGDPVGHINYAQVKTEYALTTKDAGDIDAALKELEIITQLWPPDDDPTSEANYNNFLAHKLSSLLFDLKDDEYHKNLHTYEAGKLLYNNCKAIIIEDMSTNGGEVGLRSSGAIGLSGAIELHLIGREIKHLEDKLHLK